MIPAARGWLLQFRFFQRPLYADSRIPLMMQARDHDSIIFDTIEQCVRKLFEENAPDIAYQRRKQHWIA